MGTVKSSKQKRSEKEISVLKKQVNKILKQIGDEQNLPDLCLDENNHCMLLFDERIILNMDLDEPGSLLVIYAYIGEVPIECREPIYQKVLEGNFFWKETEGATLGLDRQSQSLVLAKSFHLPMTDIHSFEDQLAIFVEVVEKWMARIERFVKENVEYSEKEKNFTKKTYEKR